MTERTTKKRRRYLILAILAAIVILPISAALIYLSKVEIDLSSRRVKIESMIKERIGQRVTIETIVLKALPSPEVTLTGLRFMDGAKPFLSIAGVRAKFSLIQLIAGNRVLKRLYLTDPVLHIKRDSAGGIKTFELIKSIRTRIKKVTRIRQLTLTGGRVNLIDELPPATELFDITGIEAGFKDSRQGVLEYEVSATLGEGAFRFNGEGRRFQGKLRLGGDGSIKNLNLKRINPYLRMRGGRPLPTGRGWQEKAGLDFKTDMVWAADDISIALEKVRLLMYGFEINGSLKAKTGVRIEGTKAQSALKSYEIALNTGPVPLEKFKELAWKVPQGKELKKHLSELTPLDGELSVEEFSIKETFDGAGAKTTDETADETPENAAAPNTRSISIKLGLKNLRFKYRRLEETFSGINGRVLYSNNTLAFEAMTGNYGAGVVKEFNGTITDVNTVPHYDLSLKAFFETEKTLAIIRRFLKKSMGSVPEKLKRLETSGLTDINLKIKGNLNTISKTDYSGTLLFKKARFAHPDLPVTLRSLDGEITFDNDRITLKALKCADDDSVLKLNGYVKGYLKKRPWFDISATGEVHRSTLLKFVKSGPVKELLFDSRVPVKIRARGTKESLKADAYADLTGTGLRFRGLIDKVRGIPLTVDASIDYAKKPGGPALIIKEMSLTAGGSKANITAEFIPGRPYSATVESKGIRFADIKGISAHIDGKTDTVGFIELAVKTDGNGEKGRLYAGRIALNNARFSSRLIPSPVERLNAEINFDGTSAKLTITDFEAGATRLIGDVDIDDIPARSIRFDIKSPELHLEDLFTAKRPVVLPEEAPAPGLADTAPPANGSLPKEIAGNGIQSTAPPARRITGTGVIKIAKGSAFGFSFNDLDAEIRLAKDAVYFSPVTMVKNNGATSMDFTIYRNPSSRLIFDGDISFTDIKLEPLITELGSKKTLFAADLTGTAVLWGMRDAKPFTAGINGEVKLSTSQGKMWKFLLLNKIFSVVNILSIDELFKDGLRYKTIEGDFAIRNGIISTTNLSLDSDSLRMSAIGELNIPDVYIDGILVMHPFVTMDKLLTAIPLAGWIIGGEKGTTLSMYYQIVGPLKKPYIEPVPAKGLQDGVVGILKRLFEEPLGGPKSKKKKDGEEAPEETEFDEFE